MNGTTLVTEMGWNSPEQTLFCQPSWRVVENRYGTTEDTLCMEKCIPINSNIKGLCTSTSTSNLALLRAKVDKKRQVPNHSQPVKDNGHRIPGKVPGTKVLSSDRRDTLDSKFKIKKIFLRCYTCHKECVDNHFTEHLFFGEATCTMCELRVTSCEHFREESLSSTCCHKFKFSRPFKYLYNRISYSLSGRDCDKIQSTRVALRLSSYLSKLKSLRGKDPWMLAISQCKKGLDKLRFQKILHIANSSKRESTNFSSVLSSNGRAPFTSKGVPISKKPRDSSVTSESYKISNAPKCPTAEGSSTQSCFTEGSKPMVSYSPRSSHAVQMEESVPSLEPKQPEIIITGFLDTPKDGYYYVSRCAIEECPMCYEELCPSRFTVNVQTFLLTTICTGCGLTIYVIFDPPDGSVPKVAIVTENQFRETKPKVKSPYRRKKEKT
ncbi:uncharacterized protein LOC134772281 [Penaeus indicus]|uniref:uncharacterized protein LOC134772281 n=1 Tax=Penaeus indicus TaxID=29960 RepID=UPI00300C2DF3